MNNKIVLGSIALDLRRVAFGYHRGSLAMAKKFHEEALKRKSEIDMQIVKPYLKNVLKKIDSLTLLDNRQKIAEDALMYSILLENAAVSSS